MMTPLSGAQPRLKRAQSALHFLSERCSSLSRELLKVSLAEMLYSCVSASTSCGVLSPKPALPPPHKQSAGAP